MKNLIPTSFDSLPAAVMGNVIVSNGGKTGTKLLKLCKLNSRTILFIEVDKTNRINTFRKFKVKDVVGLGYDGDNVLTFVIKEGVLPDKWESSWDNIGNFSRMAAGSFGYTPRPNYSNHSKGWASNARQYNYACNRKYVATGVVVSNPSTTNSSAGFPMV